MLILAVGIFVDLSGPSSASTGFASFFLLIPGLVFLGLVQLLAWPLHFVRIDDFRWDLCIAFRLPVGLVGKFMLTDFVYTFLLFPGFVGLSVLLRRAIALWLWKRKRTQMNQGEHYPQ